MIKISALIPISLILLLASCAPVHVKYDYDSEVDFASFQTFDFMTIPKDMKGKRLILKRIQRAVDQDLVPKAIDTALSALIF